MECHLRPGEVRLLLSPDDFRALTENSLVEQTIRFEPDEDRHLTLAVEARPDAPALHLTGNASRLSVVLPREQLDDWLRSDRAALSHAQPTAGGPDLRVSIERQGPSTSHAGRTTDEWFNDAVRRAAEEDAGRSVEQMSVENQPASDI